MRWLLALAIPVLCCAQQATFSLSSANIKPGQKGFLDLRIDSRVSVAIEWAIELPPNVVVVAVSQRAGSRRAAKLLSPKHYEALWLRYGEDMSAREIGRVMGMSELHARVVLHRARSRLATYLSAAPEVGRAWSLKEVG